MHCCKDDLCVCVSGEGVGAEEPAAVTIASTQPAAVFADNVQYQFRTENSSGQVSMTFDPFGGRSEFYRGQDGVRSNLVL